jgi:hypothetical protein
MKALIYLNLIILSSISYGQNGMSFNSEPNHVLSAALDSMITKYQLVEAGCYK